MVQSLYNLRVCDQERSFIENLETNMMPVLRLIYLKMRQVCDESPENQHLDTITGALHSCIAIFETIADAYIQEKKPAMALQDDLK